MWLAKHTSTMYNPASQDALQMYKLEIATKYKLLQDLGLWQDGTKRVPAAGMTASDDSAQRSETMKSKLTQTMKTRCFVNNSTASRSVITKANNRL